MRTRTLLHVLSLARSLNLSLARFYLSRIHAHFSLGTCLSTSRECSVCDRGVRAQVAAEARCITTFFRRIDGPAFALSHDDMPPYFKEFWWP